MAIEGALATGPTRTVKVQISDGHVPGTYTINLETTQIPGTLAGLAGTLLAARLNIISAVVSVGGDRTMRNIFDVVPLDGRVLDSTDEAELGALAVDFLLGRRSLGTELGDVKSLLEHDHEVVPQVDVSTDSDLTTGINISCADRPGLLYDVVSTLTAHGLCTSSLSVHTYRGRASHAFRVVDAERKPMRNASLLQAVRKDLLKVATA
jgi:[protein-PII] uridylyltransferase